MTSKTQMCGGGIKKHRAFRICLTLNYYQFKIHRYNYRSTYLNSMVTTNKKPTTGAQKQERKKHKYDTKENHQTTKEETKGRRK